LAGGGDTDFEGGLGVAEQAAGGGDRLLQRLLRIEGGDPPVGLALFEPGEVEDGVEEPGEALRLARDDGEVALRLGGADALLVVEDLREAADRRERRPELVADGREKIVLQRIELLELGVGAPQLTGGRLELP